MAKSGQREKRSGGRRVATTWPWNNRGIRQAARDLDCCYSHLSRVLSGERQSASLLARYEDWARENGATTSR